MCRPVSGNARLRPTHLLVTLGIVAILLGCGMIRTIDTPNPDPSSLWLNVRIMDADAASPTVAVTVDFVDSDAPSANNTVVLVHGETLSCNQVLLKLRVAAQIPRVQPPGVYSFTYTREGGSTTVTIPALGNPALTKPADGSVLSLSTLAGQLPLVYQPSSYPHIGDQYYHGYLIAQASDGVGHKSERGPVGEVSGPIPGILGTPTPEPLALDLYNFEPSQGTVSLTETSQNTVKDTAFARLFYEYNRTTINTVQWTL